MDSNLIKVKSLNEIKEIELKILLDIKKICESANIRYYLCGGTLLGAIRHNGFIPWDDDIDIYMPRPDVERFIKAMERVSQNYRVLKPLDEGYYYNFVKVVDINTIMIEKGINRIEGLGVFVDIIILDGMPNKSKDIKKRYRKLESLRNKINGFALTFPKVRKNLALYCWNLYRYLYCQHHTLIEAQARYINEANKFNYDTSAFVMASGGCYGLKDVFPAEWFKYDCDLEFEGFLFKGPREYDSLLRQLYGDYMKLPPLEKRKPPHQNDVYIKNKCNMINAVDYLRCANHSSCKEHYKLILKGSHQQ